MRCVLLMAVMTTAAYSVLCIRDWRARAAADRLTVSELERSVNIEPRNAEAWYRLGASELFTGADPERSIVSLHHAVLLDPNRAQYWLDLASAERMSHDSAAAREALMQALAHAPTDPLVAWEAANVTLADGDSASALRYGKTVVQFDPEHSVPMLEVLLRMIPDPARIEAEGLSPDRRAYSDFMAVLLNHNEISELMPLWQRAEGKHISITPNIAVSAANALLLSKRPVEARAIWSHLTTTEPSYREYATSSRNLVVNGGFESELLNAGLDWHLSEVPGVKVQTDLIQNHSGDRSLRIDFKQGTPQDAGVFQVIPASAAARYKLVLFTRSEDLVSASPPRIVVEDDATGSRLYESGDLNGTTTWRQVTADIHVPPTTTALRLHIVRSSSTSLVKGRLWIDDVVLKEQP